MSQRISEYRHSDVYFPVAAAVSPTFRSSLRDLPIAPKEAPGQIRGKARRVGHTGGPGEDLAIYRLKPKVEDGDCLVTITIPGFFVIEHGQFVPWEQRQHDRETQKPFSEEID